MFAEQTIVDNVLRILVLSDVASDSGYGESIPALSRRIRGYFAPSEESNMVSSPSISHFVSLQRLIPQKSPVQLTGRVGTIVATDFSQAQSSAKTAISSYLLACNTFEQGYTPFQLRPDIFSSSIGSGLRLHQSTNEDNVLEDESGVLMFLLCFCIYLCVYLLDTFLFCTHAAYTCR